MLVKADVAADLYTAAASSRRSSFMSTAARSSSHASMSFTWSCQDASSLLAIRSNPGCLQIIT